MITIKEIAALAGTSRGTVDRVLNGRGNVNAALQKRIMDIAEQHSYHANSFARTLVNSGKKYTVGVVVNSRGNKFFDDVLVGIHDAVQQYKDYGIEVIIKETKGWKESEQLKALDELLEQNLSALAITPMDTPAITEKLRSAAPLPIVTLNTDMHLDSKLAFIGCDYLNSGALCGDIVNLAMPGGGSVGIITGSFNALGHNERIAGFKQAVAQNPGIRILDVQENNDDNTLSFTVTKAMLQSHKPDLVYFCAAGTEGGVDAVKQFAPGTKVVVVDDIAAMRCHLQDGTVLAIVTQQPYRQGHTMVDILYSYFLEGKKPEHIHNYMENCIKLRSSK